MKRLGLGALGVAAFLALPLDAQETEVIPGAEDLFGVERSDDALVLDQNLDEFLDEGVVTTETRARVASGRAAVLRGLDKLTGQVGDYEVPVGATVEVGRLSVTVGDCRYPVNNPSGNAFAYLKISEVDIAELRFQGWMVAESPALNALEHPRYDVWVMRCRT
ncbi:DUF2155 domain-containing protein [Palleronia caenipelagi]|uniref:DUF2155 domain-containing protein n=1 Tax=Palleronia caenipelagi TaxID=2489174 RepID=A0A547PRH0_9RHOB|nr:DUF2155 domain-containing protein [Palleronia caenipelagi]TRD16691.1 DUF2155 domain-containing protein [Palleronia caenipelagi]